MALSLLAVDELDINHGIADGSLVACSDRGIGMLNLGNSFQRSQNSIDSSPGLIDGGIRRGLEVDLEFSLVVPGKELGLEKELEDHQSAYKREDGDQKDCLAVFQSPGDDDAVLIRGSIKPVD